MSKATMKTQCRSVEQAASGPSGDAKRLCNDAFLVVQFYKRNGFAVGDTVEGYYKRLTPSDAIVLSKQLDQL